MRVPRLGLTEAVPRGFAGRHMTALLEVTMERDRIDMIDNFKRAALAEPDVAAYEAFTRRFLYSNPDVAKFRTMVVLDRVKFEFRHDIAETPAG